MELKRLQVFTQVLPKYYTVVRRTTAWLTPGVQSPMLGGYINVVRLKGRICLTRPQGIMGHPKMSCNCWESAVLLFREASETYPADSNPHPV